MDFWTLLVHRMLPSTRTVMEALPRRNVSWPGDEHARVVLLAHLQTQLLDQACDCAVDAVLRDPHALGDLGVGVARGDEAHHLDLRVGERRAFGWSRGVLAVE